MFSERDLIWRRSGHLVFAYDGEMWIWGGMTEHLPERPRLPNTIPRNANNFLPSNELFIYDPASESWRRVRTHGDNPPQTVGAAGALVGDAYYVFGGYSEFSQYDDIDFEQGHSNRIFKLNLRTLKWQKIEPKTAKKCPLPVDKACFYHHQGYLYTFGGYGDAPEPVTHYPLRPVFHSDPSTSYDWPRGWNANTCRFSIQSQEWEWVKTKGQIPEPRSGFAYDFVDNFLIIVGGRSCGNRHNDVYCFNVKTSTWKCLSEGCAPDTSSWHYHFGGTGLQIDRDTTVRDDKGNEHPEPRSLHSMTRIDGTEGGCYSWLVYGGLGLLCAPLNDAWILKVDKETLSSADWTQMDLEYDHGEVRCWHGSCKVGSEVLIHSGSTQDYRSNRLELDDHPVESVQTFSVGVKSLVRTALDFLVENPELLLAQTDGPKEEGYKELDKTLPRNLADIIKHRLMTRAGYGSVWSVQPPPDTNSPVLSRKVIHSGM